MNKHTLVKASLICMVVTGSRLSAAEFVILGPGRAYAVSADGSRIAGTDFVLDQGWLWTRDEGLSVLEPLAGDEFVIPYGMSADGSIVGGQSGTTATIWTANEKPIPLINSVGTFSLVWHVAAEGNTFVGTSNSQAFHATSADDVAQLDALPQHGESFALGQSADGDVVAGVSRSPTEATVWVRQNGDYSTIGLGRPDGLDTWARFVSSDGLTVVGGVGEDIIGHWFPFGGVDEPFRWTASSGMVPLGILDGTVANTPTGISSDASVIVGNTDDPGQSFVWDEIHGMRNLQAVLENEHGVNDLSGLDHITIRSMSADATTLVGNMGECRGCPNEDLAWALFLDRPLVVVPEPSSVHLLIAGLIVAFRRLTSRRVIADRR